MAINNKEVSQEQRGNQDLLTQTIEEYRKGPLTPELVTNYWRANLQVDGARAGLNIEVPDCDWTEEEIKRPMVDIEGNAVPGMMIYFPEQLIGKEGKIHLEEMYPEMANSSMYDRSLSITDTHKTTGWIKVEAAIETPNRNTRQKALEAFAKKQGYLGQRENAFILASKASKDLTGSCFGQRGTCCRLLGSPYAGRVMYALFNSDGNSYIFWLVSSEDQTPLLGARFEEVKRT